MTLTPKQQRFVEEYLVDFNATRAAIRAGYSKKTAYSQGERLLRHAEVAAAVEAGKAELAKLTRISAEEVIEGLRREADYHGEGASHSARVKTSSPATPSRAAPGGCCGSCRSPCASKTGAWSNDRSGLLVACQTSGVAVHGQHRGLVS